MRDRIKNTTSIMVKKNLSNKWFIVSVVTTVLLIILLVIGLVHSHRTPETLESNGLAIEEASGNLLLHTKELEMAAHMAAATGDLRWKNTHNEIEPLVTQVLEDLPEMIELEEVTEKIQEINSYLADIRVIENQVFSLISQGNKEEAMELISGWNYTKNQLALAETTEELTTIMQNHTEERIAFEEKVTSFLLISVVFFLILLIISWFISIKIWKENFAKIREKEEEITYLSYHDSLTGLFNRRYFEYELKRLDKEQEIPITIIVGDANRLKELNDTLGHQTGDELLMEISRIFQKTIGDKGIISRWGGDEFGAILPNTDTAEAEAIIDQINEECKNSDFEPENPSISIGYAVKTSTNHSIDQIFTLAETKMYQVKNGR